VRSRLLGEKLQNARDDVDVIPAIVIRKPDDASACQPQADIASARQSGRRTHVRQRERGLFAIEHRGKAIIGVLIDNDDFEVPARLGGEASEAARELCLAANRGDNQ
jgi:hypothetical protein